jgi:uncharacterized protein YjaG (DUF416 family)
MNYQEYIRLLKKYTSSQSYEHQLKFAVLISQKLYHEYQIFFETYGSGNPKLLMDAILLCQQIFENTRDSNTVKMLLQEIDLIIPHIDDFGGDKIASYALNASAAVYETLELINDKNSLHTYNIANYYTDTIDFKIQEGETLTEEEIENHPLMIEAWNFVLGQLKPYEK